VQENKTDKIVLENIKAGGSEETRGIKKQEIKSGSEAAMKCVKKPCNKAKQKIVKKLENFRGA